jgi:hypothetical protein
MFLTTFWSFQREFSFNGRLGRNTVFRLHLNSEICGESVAFEFIDLKPFSFHFFVFRCFQVGGVVKG